MWPWVVAGWIALSIAVTFVHKRLRRAERSLPAEVEEFLLRLETALRRRHPHVDYLGLLPGQFAVLLAVRGQETPVSLHGAWRHVQAYPDSFDAMVDRLVKDIEEIGLDRLVDHDFLSVVTCILPQVRSREWLERQGCFGDGALVHSPLGGDLVVTYVIDDEQCMVFVCQGHLRRWQKREADLFHLALANLQRRGDPGLGRARGPLLLQTGDGYDAARVLLLERDADGLLVAMPDRDLLWVGPEQEQDLAALMSATAALAAQAQHPVSGSVYRMRAGRLEPLTG